VWLLAAGVLTSRNARRRGLARGNPVGRATPGGKRGGGPARTAAARPRKGRTDGAARPIPPMHWAYSLQ